MEIKTWTELFLTALERTFAQRIWFVGLQGSYGRGEATETSDIDMVVILDEVSASDIGAYNMMLDTLPHRELVCGFLAGREELLRWEPSDLFQFYHDTTAIKGNLDELLPQIDTDAVDRAIRSGVCNIYHGCVHNMLYEKSDDILRGLYKAASFVIQAICYQKAGVYITHLCDLADKVCAEDHVIVTTFSELKNGRSIDFDAMSQTLFTWAKQQLNK